VGRACGTHGRGEKSVQGFGGKARWKDGIRMGLREFGWCVCVCARARVRVCVCARARVCVGTGGGLL
jgi:hypothetical protein